MFITCLQDIEDGMRGPETGSEYDLFVQHICHTTAKICSDRLTSGSIKTAQNTLTLIQSLAILRDNKPHKIKCTLI